MAGSLTIERLQRIDEAIVVATGAPRRVMAGSRTRVAPAAFECPGGMRRPLSPTADIPSHTSVAAKCENATLLPLPHRRETELAL